MDDRRKRQTSTATPAKPRDLPWGLTGLYVESDDRGLHIPDRAISPRQSQALIQCAEAFIKYAESEKPRDDIPQEEFDLQIWFLNAFDDPEMRKRVLTVSSLATLKELNDVHEWTRVIKAGLEAEDQRLMVLAQEELSRGPKSSEQMTKEKWRLVLKLETASHSIRATSFKKSNEGVKWLKLRPQQGAKRKEQLLIEMTLGDDIPLSALWGVGFSLSLQFIIAINMATSGYWWWPLAPNQRRFYESIRNLENGLGVEIEGGGFRVFGDRRPLFTEQHVQSLLLCLTSLPHPQDQSRAQAYVSYLGGLTFISLNCIQWRCEAEAFGNFLAAFKLLMVEASYILPSKSAETAIGRFLDEKYPGLDDQAKFLAVIGKYAEQGRPQNVKFDDVYLMKLLCETIFRDIIVPQMLRRKEQTDSEENSSDAEPEAESHP